MKEPSIICVDSDDDHDDDGDDNVEGETGSIHWICPKANSTTGNLLHNNNIWGDDNIVFNR